MIRTIYEEIVCPECDGIGCVEGRCRGADRRICELVTCPECSGSGSVRAAVLARAYAPPLTAA